MQTAETLLAIYGERGRHGKLLEGIYRQLFNPELYLRAYHRLAKNEGAMTRGATEETVDAMSKERIQGIIELLRHERYRWTPVRRVLIPKGDGKLRPLGIPSWSDKLLQEVMPSLLSAYYEPQFNGNSHGFRPGRGCHTALRDVYRYWTGTKWFIEGDIKGCFDIIDHSILMSILREKIRDGRFLTLVEDLLEAGYLEEWKYRHAARRDRQSSACQYLYGQAGQVCRRSDHPEIHPGSQTQEDEGIPEGQEQDLLHQEGELGFTG